jgi:hypothetical protein
MKEESTNLREWALIFKTFYEEARKREKDYSEYCEWANEANGF